MKSSNYFASRSDQYLKNYFKAGYLHKVEYNFTYVTQHYIFRLFVFGSKLTKLH